jgi:hypothetical protein
LNGGNEEQFSVMVPERAFRAGRNRIQLFLAAGDRLVSTNPRFVS